MRVSTDRQETVRQENEIRAHCFQRDYRLLDILGENGGKSGRTAAVKHSPGAALRYYRKLIRGDYEALERPQYAELLNRVESGEIDAVIFYALDRFSRDCLELLILDLILRANDTKMICISQGGEVSTDSAAGKFMYRIMAAQSEMECDQGSERIKHTLKNKKEARGENWHTRPRVGWKKVDGEFVHDPEKWPVIVNVYELREEGHTYREITSFTGVPRTMIKYYIDAYNWQAPLTKEQLGE
jgi:DNA invertase Pin-like site-specific DNA recombinase